MGLHSLCLSQGANPNQEPKALHLVTKGKNVQGRFGCYMMFASREWNDSDPVAHTCLWEDGFGAVQVEQNHKQAALGSADHGWSSQAASELNLPVSSCWDSCSHQSA